MCLSANGAEDTVHVLSHCFQCTMQWSLLRDKDDIFFLFFKFPNTTAKNFQNHVDNRVTERTGRWLRDLHFGGKLSLKLDFFIFGKWAEESKMVLKKVAQRME